MRLVEYISQEKIQSRLISLAEEINDYISCDSVVVVGILKGSFMFFADLTRNLHSHHIEMDFIATESYVDTQSSGEVKITKDLSSSVAGKRVLLVEDIVDTGVTLSHLKNYFLQNHRAKEVKICALLDKPTGRKKEIQADYIGFVIENEFVVGYGLDYNQRYRNIPYIAILEEDDTSSLFPIREAECQ